MSAGVTMAIVALRVGGGWFGAEARLIREVVPRQNVTRIPSMPPHILGLASVRGRVVPVVELTALVPDIPAGEPARTAPRWVVLNTDVHEVAIEVDETRGVLRVAGTIPDGEQPNPRDVLHGSATWERRQIPLLDVARIIRMVEGVQ